jgi:hypothetical protein
LSHAGVPSIGSYSHPTVIQDQVILACREDVRNNIQKSLRFPVNDPGGVRERKEAQIRHPFCTRAKRQSGRVTVEVLLSCSAFYDTKTLIHSRSSRSSSAHRDRHSKDSLRPDADKKPILYGDYPGVNEDSDPIVISDDDDAELTTYVFFFPFAYLHTTFADIALLIPTESKKGEMVLVFSTDAASHFVVLEPPSAQTAPSRHCAALHHSARHLSTGRHSASCHPVTHLGVMSPSQG